MSNKEHPLVSVPVITYNSAMTVIETLESIKAQTYQNIELIVSDDCSTDNTVEICKNWIEENKSRFAGTKVIVAPKNKGISANYNQGMDNCTGDYIKEIAGDDMLLPDCIQDYMEFVIAHPRAYFCFGKAEVFDGDEERRKHYEQFFLYDYFQLSSQEQYRSLLEEGNFICSATFFYNRKKMIELGIRNDERIPMMEDYPKWINILAKGEKLSFLDKEVVKYRMSSTGLSSQKELPLLWRQQFALLELLYRQPYERRKKRLSPRKIWRRKMYAKQLIEKNGIEQLCLRYMNSGLVFVGL